MTHLHARIEMLAGAIALGEATDAQRREYREHVSSCERCLRELGGELELERTAAVVAQARDSETWQPDLRDAVALRLQQRVRRWQYGFGVAALCVAVSLGVHALLAGGVTPLATPPLRSTVLDVGATRIVLEQRANKAPQAAAPAPPERQLVVLHNVVSMQRAPATPIPQRTVNMPSAATAPRRIAAVTVHPRNAPARAHDRDQRPVWDRVPADSWRTVATTTTTSQFETAPQTFTHNAESLQFAPAHHDREVSLAGGETSLNPQPPMIAYDEGAQGTSAFEVLVDERGTPTKCVITKSSGYLVLDKTVCKAAMSAKYLPKIENGRAVPGVYRDAFTFRMRDNPDIEGVQRPF